MDLAALVRLHLEKPFPELAQPLERLALAMELSRDLELKVKKAEVDKVLRVIELPLIPVLYRMERHGVLIDKTSLDEYSLELKTQIKKIEGQIFDLVGQVFNVGSPKQLGQILFEKLKLPVIRKTKTGFSTDSDVLEKLKDKHAIAEMILTWRELSKLNSTYVEALPQLINTKTGRVHTNYNQTITSTGRLSSMHPNLQNIPIRTPRGQRIRNSFVAPQGFGILSADYSQVELRLLAHITKDKALSHAFEKDLDIHAATAAEIFGVELDSVNSDQRRTAKAINFGIVYGMSEFGLAENLGLERRAAADFIKRYFDKYPGVKKYMEEVVQSGTELGYVKTIFGRKRYYPGLKSSNRNIRQMAERAAINMPIQGAAADLIKLAMVHADKDILDGQHRERMIMQVHDELVFEVPNEEIEATKARVTQWMNSAATLHVPLKIDLEWGSHWS
jgi:DNA polymerase-1